MVTPECVDLLGSMVQKDPALRPSAREALQHSWFQSEKETLNNLLLINKFMCAKDFDDIEQNLIDLH